jgi:hypothetical protein
MEATVKAQLSEWQQRVTALQTKMSRVQDAARLQKERTDTLEREKMALEAQAAERMRLLQLREAELAVAQRNLKLLSDQAASAQDALDHEARPLVAKLQQRVRVLERASPSPADVALERGSDLAQTATPEDLARTRALDTARWDQDKKTQKKMELLQDKVLLCLREICFVFLF